MGDVVILNQVEDLGFIYVTRISPGVQNSVGIKGKGLSIPVLKTFFRHAAHRLGAEGGLFAKQFLLSQIQCLLEGVHFSAHLNLSLLYQVANEFWIVDTGLK